MKLTHIINPVKVKQSSDLFVAQPITFESMKAAQLFAKDKLDISLVTTQYAEDREIIPSYFNITEDLESSVLDYGHFNKQRKLPLINDILQKAVDFNTEADYIIYTNADIALQPYFYLFVKEQIDNGLDAFVINRRTISNSYTSPKELSLMYSEIGEAHPGFDCFIFKREFFKGFELGKVCIGTTRIGLSLITNLIVQSNNFKVFKKEHLTFHVGEDKVWLNKELDDYVEHNEREVKAILKFFKSKHKEKFESSEVLKKYYNNLFLDLSNISQESKKKTFSLKRIFKR